ncbi:MotA/TolQ/ExbB proton channel family protein [Campylobacter sp. CCS1377]|uniref:MotA/TolQ/ExbB proton channel family protein n=1 Tax=Campylobacter sp. CCS1377 TaxID=3158229 RepID=A0AAU7EA21_9BACT
MATKSDKMIELVLPEVKERKGFLVYFKIILAPFLAYLCFALAYFNFISLRIDLNSFAMISILFFIALILAKYNAEYDSNIFEQQKLEFKQNLKQYIIKHFLTIGKETKANASFDNFAYDFVTNIRNEQFTSVATSIFPMLGVLGTFISLAISMPNFTSNDIANLEGEISYLLIGVSSAFYISAYGIFLALWWVFFEKYGKNKIQKLINRQKNATSNFFWTKEELEHRYLYESLKHFDKIGLIVEQVSNQDFFTELDQTINRKFELFQDMFSVEEKAIRISNEYIKQTMNDLHKSQKEQKDIGKLYSEILNAVGIFNQNLKDVNLRMSEQYNRLLDISSEKTHHLDKTLSSLDEKIELFQRNFEYYQKSMLENQEKIFNGFKTSLLEGMKEFREIYEEEKSLDSNLEIMSQLKNEITELNSEASEMISKLEESTNNAK